MRGFVTRLTWLVWLTGWVGSLVLVAAFTPAAVVETHAAAQTRPTAAVRMAMNEESYREVLPGVETFETEDGLYKHIRGYRSDANGDNELVGFVYLTQDLGARSRGYIGLIPILVGMDLRGRITGVKILKHFEPYGYRSINLPEFRAQFEGKSIFDKFAVGADIDAYSGATITTVAATKSIRHASRRMAREFLVRKTESPEPHE